MNIADSTTTFGSSIMNLCQSRLLWVSLVFAQVGCGQLLGADFDDVTTGPDSTPKPDAAPDASELADVSLVDATAGDDPAADGAESGGELDAGNLDVVDGVADSDSSDPCAPPLNTSCDLEEDLTLDANYLWKIIVPPSLDVIPKRSGLDVPVCWETAGYDKEKGWVQSAVDQVWESEGNITFTGWDPCADDDSVHLAIADDVPKVAALGSDLAGLPAGLTLNVKFGKWAPACAADEAIRERCVRRLASHQFAYALGFTHPARTGTLACDSADVGLGPSSDPGLPQWLTLPCQGIGRANGQQLFELQYSYGSPIPVSAISSDGISARAFILSPGIGLQESDQVALAPVTSSWSAWSNLGESSSSAPVVLSFDSSGRVDLLARGTDSELLHGTAIAKEWRKFERIPGPIVGTPAAVAISPDSGYVFARGADGALKILRWDDSHWSEWQDAGVQFVGIPSAAYSHDDTGMQRIDVCVRSIQDEVLHATWNGSQWSEWDSLGGSIHGSPVVVSRGWNAIDVFARTSGDALIVHSTEDGATWSYSLNSPSTSHGRPAALAFAGNDYVFVRGGRGDVAWLQWSPVSGWGNWQTLGLDDYTLASPTAIVVGGAIDVLVRGMQSDVDLNRGDLPAWTGWINLLGKVQ